VGSRGTEYEDVDWILLAQDRVQWQTVVNMVMNCKRHKIFKQLYDCQLLSKNSVVWS